MKIHGLQKLTLLDYPEHTACTVFLAGCNMRCPFCHNSELIDGRIEPVTDDIKLIEFLEKRKGLLDAVVFTGGEPLLNPGIAELTEKVRALGYLIKLDTNGTKPEKLKYMIDNKLVDYVAMDIKNSKSRYAITTGIASFDLRTVEESVRLLLTEKVDYEFRTTTVKELHDEQSFRDIAEWIEGAKRFYIQPFKDRDTVKYKLTTPSDEELRYYAEIVRPHVEFCGIRALT